MKTPRGGGGGSGSCGGSCGEYGGYSPHGRIVGRRWEALRIFESRWEIGVFLGVNGWEGVFATPRLHAMYRENINPPSTFRIRFHVVVMLRSSPTHALMHEHTPRQDARIRTTLFTA